MGSESRHRERIGGISQFEGESKVSVDQRTIPGARSRCAASRPRRCGMLSSHDASHRSFWSRAANSAPRAGQPRNDDGLDRRGGWLCLGLGFTRHEAQPIIDDPQAQAAEDNQYQLQHLDDLDHRDLDDHDRATTSHLHHTDAIRYLRRSLGTDLRRGPRRRPRTRPARRVPDHRLSGRSVEPDLVGRDPQATPGQVGSSAHGRTPTHRFHLDRQGVRPEPRGL